MSVEMWYEGCLYGYVRDRFTSEGKWMVVSGSCPELIGGDNAGTFVPVIFDNFLTETAKEKNIAERHNFAKTKPEPKPEPRVRGPRKNRERQNVGIKGKGLKLNISLGA